MKNKFFLRLLILTAYCPSLLASDSLFMPSKKAMLQFSAGPAGNEMSVHGFNTSNSLSMGFGTFSSNYRTKNFTNNVNDTLSFKQLSMAFLLGVNFSSPKTRWMFRNELGHHFVTDADGGPNGSIHYAGAINYKIDIFNIGLGLRCNLFKNIDAYSQEFSSLILRFGLFF